MTDSLLITVHDFVSRVSMSVSVFFTLAKLSVISVDIILQVLNEQQKLTLKHNADAGRCLENLPREISDRYK